MYIYGEAKAIRALYVRESRTFSHENITYSFFILFTLILVWHFLTKKYLNPYKLYIIFGPKGIGKSTLLQKLADYYIKRHYNVYCNIGDCNAPGVIQIPIDDLPRLSRAGHLIYHYKDFSLAHQIEEEYKRILSSWMVNLLNFLRSLNFIL